MDRKKLGRPVHEEQHKAFVDAAREVGASEDEASFDKMLKRVTSAPPPKTVQERKTRAPKKPR